VSDVDNAAVDILKVLGPKRPTREADSCAAANSITRSTSSAWVLARACHSEITAYLPVCGIGPKGSIGPQCGPANVQCYSGAFPDSPPDAPGAALI
jgi:hypothetical protein